MLAKAHYLMKPMLLRRVKTEVEQKLPKKKVITLNVPLAPLQLHWYKSLLAKDCGVIFRNMNDSVETHDSTTNPNPNEKSSSDWKKLQSLLMQLRKCCNHPFLFDGADPNPTFTDHSVIEASGKMMLLDRLLHKLKEGGHRVCLFSQFTRVLDILEDYARWRGFEFCRLDGSTNRVQRMIDVRRFNQKGSTKFMYLMSTRAGGLGINLATADTVILFDSDWNPQVDLQAMDRVHRIGQTKVVHVYRLVTEGTVEQRMLQRAQRKLFLDKMVNRDSSANSAALDSMGLSKKDVCSMLKFGANAIFKSRGKKMSDAQIDYLIDRSKVDSKSSLDNLDSGIQMGQEENAEDFDAEADVSAIRNFQGQEFSNMSTKKKTPSTLREIAASSHHLIIPKNSSTTENIISGGRKRTSRFIEIDGHRILKLNNYDLESGESSVFGQELKETVHRSKDQNATRNSRQVAGRDFMNESHCLACWDGGNIICCDLCPASYHPACCGIPEGEVTKRFVCPHHSCLKCNRKAAAAGGLLFRCIVCPAAFCEDDLPEYSTIVGRCERMERLGMRQPKQACFIYCNDQCKSFAEGEKYRELCKQEIQYDLTLNGDLAKTALNESKKAQDKKTIKTHEMNSLSKNSEDGTLKLSKDVKSSKISKSGVSTKRRIKFVMSGLPPKKQRK